MCALSTQGGLYAAYGSNMDPEQMLQRCPHSPAAGTGWLVGWRLTFGGEEHGWDGALPMIVPDPGGRVFVALFEVSPHDMVALDRWEGADTGLYDRIRLRVQAGDGLTGGADDATLLATVYVLDAFEGGLPSARMIGLMADAAEAAGAPEDYVSELRNRECRSIG